MSQSFDLERLSDEGLDGAGGGGLSADAEQGLELEAARAELQKCKESLQMEQQKSVAMSSQRQLLELEVKHLKESQEQREVG